MRRATLKVRSVTAAAAMALVLTACGPLERIADAVTDPSDADLVEAVSLTPDDAAPGAAFSIDPGGDQVVGQVSLDLCYGDFPSEELRSGRRQVVIADEDGTNWVSSEAILYPTPEDADQAMAELEQAADECPAEPVAPPQDWREPLIWEFGAAPDEQWPDTAGVRRQAYLFDVTTPDGVGWTSTATYLQRGRMILALYATGPDSASATLRNAPSPGRFVAVMSSRLADLPEDSLDYGEPLDDPHDIIV